MNREMQHICLKNLKNDYDENNALSLDILNLRKNHQELFWNLVYRFIQDKRDYTFLVPYESHIFPDADKKSDEYDLRDYKLEVKKDEEENHSNEKDNNNKEVEKRLQNDEDTSSQNNN